ncbi:MAG: multicopper oxidase family protein [Gemmatimonadetes bacterium]|nr:multicopper oxidase family protein [Gemmatimonadota bacterium]MYC91118.1 multicopper oxidase family protein [Gemmatimonadota bacterium]
MSELQTTSSERRRRLPPLLALVLAAAWAIPASAAPQDTTRARGMDMNMQMNMSRSMDTVRGSGDMIMMMLRNPMLPGLRGVSPSVDPFLPGEGVDTASLAWATPREILHVADGDTIALEARIVKRRIGGRTFVMYGFNGQYPGPLLRVAQNTRIVVRFTNSIDLPSTIHWHGLRLENRFDGVPDVTQPPVPPGGEFVYEIVFPDAGLYWYHPHVREDIQQDAGLYGNMFVDPARDDYFGPATREEFIMVDDLLVDGDELLPWGKGASNFTIMGRFGNVMLVNGEERYAATVRPGEVVRFFVTNVSNTRSYNLSFAGLDMKLVGTDLSRFQREMMVESLVISPAERYIVEVRFPAAGPYALLNQVQVVDHMRGTFYAAVDTLGAVVVEGPEVEEADALLSSHSIMRTDAVLEAELAEFRPHFDRPVDHALLLTVDIEGLPILVQQFISIDTIYRPPVEWTDGMPNMNWLSTSNEVRWILRDEAVGTENAEIDWRFRLGDVVKIRLRNDADAFHPMHHPIHLHGQRFLVLSRDGVPNRNLAWKDTVLVPVGSTVDLLMEASNPGEWMIHCHIAEHLDAGMMGSFTVVP